MRLAILADIHGNIHALDAVLADIETQSADRLVVNGDLVNRGPNNVAVVERVLSLGATVTLGNHDDLMRKWVERDDDIPEHWFGDPLWEGMAWSARQLADANLIGPLRDLPLTHRINAEGAPTLLVSHGSPRHYREGYGRYLSDQDIAEIITQYPADVLVGSHTHQPMARRWGPHHVLNTGSVGTPFNGDPRAQYLLLTLEDEGWRPEFRSVPYDRDGALRAFETSGLLADGQLGGRIFFEEARCARSFFTPFWMWTEEQSVPQNWDTWQQFRDTFTERFRPARLSANENPEDADPQTEK
ncbi:MAG: metallophosphoesterase family protein [Trueperaceae bacterium]|nr:metallophosphoesterase family protein [Trueperaceae bacterium]